MPTGVFSRGHEKKAGTEPAKAPAPKAPSAASRREHEGRTPQPGVPAGPRDTEHRSASGYEYTPAEYKAAGLTPPQSRRQAAATAKVKAAKRSERRQQTRTNKALVIVAKHQAAAAIPVAKIPHDYSVPASKDPKIKAAMAEQAKGFAKEQGTKLVPVAAHVRQVPVTRKQNVQQNPAKAMISSKPQPKVTPQEKHAARAKVQQARAAVQKSRVASALPGLDPEGQHVARTVLSIGKKMGASKKEMMAAAETGLVESGGFHNLKGGDADSEGWRQERRAFYPEPTNVRAGAKNFFSESKTDPTIPGGGGETAGELAQTVQGSAFPERYEEHRGEAAAIIKAFYGGKPNPQAIKNLKAAKKEAVELGLKVGGPGVGPAPKKVVTKFRQIKHAAAELESKNLPYSWGGGHDPNFSPGGEGENGGPGYDCSGAVSFVLHQAGVLSEPLTSGSMGSVLKPGPGAVTVFYNAEHTFMKIGNEYWGTSVGDSGAGGIGKHPTPSASYLAAYNVGHVPGLGKKQALQLGFKPGSLTSTGSSASAEAFPGMTLSESGTTATIDKGQGSKNPGKPGFSKKPIELTPNQIAHRTLRKLKKLGAGLGEAEAAPEESKGSALAALEKKYGKAAV